MKLVLFVTLAVVLSAVDLSLTSPVKVSDFERTVKGQAVLMTVFVRLQEAPVAIEYMARLMPSDVEIKHVGGVDIDANDNMIIFHRGSRVWKGE